MPDQFRLFVKAGPAYAARLVWVVLERKKLKVLHAVVLLKVSDEAAKPGGFPLRVRPDLDVLVDALEGWAAELEAWVNFTDRRSKLQVKRVVAFRRHVLAI